MTWSRRARRLTVIYKHANHGLDTTHVRRVTETDPYRVWLNNTISSMNSSWLRLRVNNWILILLLHINIKKWNYIEYSTSGRAASLSQSPIYLWRAEPISPTHTEALTHRENLWCRSEALACNGCQSPIVPVGAIGSINDTYLLRRVYTQYRLVSTAWKLCSHVPHFSCVCSVFLSCSSWNLCSNRSWSNYYYYYYLFYSRG